jgi:hypothetical protein
MSARVGEYIGPVAITAPGAARRWRETEIAATVAAPVWKTVLIDALAFVLVIWSIPVAILLVGSPIVMSAGLVIGFVRWILQP